MERRSRQRESSGGAQLALVVVLLALAAGLFCWRSGALRRMLRRSLPEGARRAGYQPAPDVGAPVFADFCEAEEAGRGFELSITKPSDRFAVRREDSPVGTRAFRVKPEHYFQFVSADIAALVKTGLTARTLSGEPCAPFYGAPKIKADAEDRSWTVTVPDVSGEGIVSLSVHSAVAEHRVERPRIFPVWKFIQYSEPAEGPGERGRIFAQGCTVMEKDRSKENDKDCSVIAANKAQNFCGFRVHGVSGRCVWLEVVYYKLSREIARSRWPDVSVVYRVRDGSVAPPVVRFADGTEMASGRYALDGGDSLELDGGGILDDGAVRFSYLGADGRKIADVICVNLLQTTF